MAYTPTDWTLNAIATELGVDRRRVGKALEGIEPVREDKRAKYYRMRDVFRGLTKADAATGTAQTEKARLDRLRADQVELTLHRDRGEMFHRDDVLKLWTKIIADVRQRLLSVPVKAAPVCHKKKKITEVREVLKKEIHDALQALTEFDATAYTGKSGTAKVRPPSGSDGQ